MLFNAGVSELWRRTTIYALRALGALPGMSVRAVAKEVRLVLREGGRVPTPGRSTSTPWSGWTSVTTSSAPRRNDSAPSCWRPPCELAARRVSAPCAGQRTTTDDRVRWGRELDVAVVTDRERGRRRAAAYLAKYSTKSTEDHGVLDHRLRAGVPDASSCRPSPELVERPGDWADATERAPLRAWAHTAGYQGHCLTKSRRFSTTFAALGPSARSGGWTEAAGAAAWRRARRR